MIKKTFITGDTHGAVVRRLITLKWQTQQTDPSTVALIILGDCGINYYCGEKDRKNKEEISSYGYTIYCVRGNHEERPEELESTEVIYDDFVNGLVYYEPQFPLIKYFVDCSSYEIMGKKTLVIGGAYSVDKYYRLEQGLHWFPKEQLTEEEMKSAEKALDSCQYDLILAHTCPYSWRPTDLFLTCVDQNKVDSSMELWLENIKDKFSEAIYLFGHYHANRLVRPKVQMFYHEIENFKDIIERWSCGKRPDYYFEKDPKYYQGR